MGFDIGLYISTRKSIVDKRLSEILVGSSQPVTRLEESMRYSVLAGGKRLRPILCIAAGEAVGGTIESILPIACAIEMIHTYSLIHDDLPSMDDDLLRRGMPTNHSVFGEAVAILAGDALLTDAFFVIANEGVSVGLSPSSVIEIIRDISKAAGSAGMVGGQALDLALEGKEDVTVELVEKMHSLKTGALIEASIVCGGRIGKADEEQLSQLRQYGRCLGLSFQIIDDVLDIEGGTEIGKTRGADVRRKKATYPALLGVERSRELALKLTEMAVSALSGFDERADPLRELALYLGGRRY
ncbi:MAG TPA: farnesyl diphosphate synthase [Thermodesulfobacteriota bacterium]|jgi:geranylgeranyl diphosphate synthase type II|nr:farnesyl diphosphate synthase [Thermodesulfobacteriota bacterium]